MMGFLLRVGLRGKNLFFSTEVNVPDAGTPGKVFIGMEVGVGGAKSRSYWSL